jgi:hypothetical protein
MRAAKSRLKEPTLCLFALPRFASSRIGLTCLFVVSFTLIATAAGYTHTVSQPAPPPAQANVMPDAKAASDAKPPTDVKITSVVVFPQARSQTASQAPSTQDFILEINGTGLTSIDTDKAYIAVLPATGVTPTQIPLSLSPDKSKILAQFTAPASYALEAIALWTGSGLVPFDTGASSCDFDSKAKLTPQMVPKSQAGNKYGNGVAKNFYAIQISIVNECPIAIIVPLAGIKVVVLSDDQNAGKDKKDSDSKEKSESCAENGDLVAFSLDHVTSIYSADRKLTGRRAIYFNTLQALATLGSSVELFLPHGFTQGVAILGGGFTTASKDILVDMSAEQLQNLTSQSFGATEQVAAHGSLQKFVFIRRSEKCKKERIETDLRNGKFAVKWELSPAAAEAPKTQTAPAQTQTKQPQKN